MKRLTERDQKLLDLADRKLDDISIIELKAKLLKKIVSSHDAMLNRGYDIGVGNIHALIYEQLIWNFDNMTYREMEELLVELRKTGKKQKEILI